jgi:hypothetical protein
MAEQHLQFDKAKQENEDTLLTEWGHFKYELVIIILAIFTSSGFVIR